MKKLIVWIIVGIAAVYGIGRYKLSEASAEKFLASMDRELIKGGEFCDLLHDDVEYSVTNVDSSTEEGGRDQFCTHLNQASTMLQGMKGRAEITVARDNLKVERDWKHPWTGHYTFSDTTTIRATGSGKTMSVASDSSMTLVMTLTGLKLRKSASTIVSAERG